MKKIVSRVLEVLLTSLFYGFPAWLSATVAIFAFNQNFGVGLVIMLGLVVVQLIASMKISDLEWNEFSSFNFRDMGPDYKVGARFNIIFNLTRVGTIISSLAFLFKSGFEINPFGGLGLTISIVISVIALVLFLSISDLNHNYEYVRGLLAVLAIVLLLVFSYLYFGTQLIWIPALLILVFSYSKCFYELDDGEYGPFAFLAPILLGLTSVISTVIQFSQEIIGWIDEVFEMIGVIIMSFLTLKLLYVPLWVCFSALALAFIVRKIGTTITKKSNQNKFIKPLARSK